MALLEVKHLTVEFESGGRFLPAVTDVSFHLDDGELLALVGESGCGKSVSCMALARLLPEPPARIADGEVLLRRADGETEDVLRLPEHSLRHVRGGGIAYIFQEPSVSLNPVFRVGNQIAEAVELHRPGIADPAEETIRLLRLVGIPSPEERAKQYPHEMSGGMQQRVMIAMGLACHPRVLVADEPTTALDVTIQAQILGLLRTLRDRDRMSVILVTHNLGIVSELADRVAVMYAGRIVETASARDLLDHPAHPYTAALLRAVPVLGGGRRQLCTIPGAVPLPENFVSGCRFHDRCGVWRELSPENQTLCRTVPPDGKACGTAGHFCWCHFPPCGGEASTR